MQYYHVYVNVDGDESREKDLTREELQENIINPYLRNKKFLCMGTFIRPNDIDSIRILETELPSSTAIQNMRREKGLTGLLADDFTLLEESGREVTREFIRAKTRVRIRRISVKKNILNHSKDVFIVHGKDHRTVAELKKMLSKLGLNPIVLHEQPSGSKTIIEKIEEYSDVGYAFVVLTPDDVGCTREQFLRIFKLCLSSRDETNEKKSKKLEFFFRELPPLLRSRARQNVVLEFGYFIGKLGRSKVCCLYKGDVELPSDMHGIVYVSFKDSLEEAGDMIVKELRRAGYKIAKRD
jgi:predicted nucleotide-binding protein